MKNVLKLSVISSLLALTACGSGLLDFFDGEFEKTQKIQPEANITAKQAKNNTKEIQLSKLDEMKCEKIVSYIPDLIKLNASWGANEVLINSGTYFLKDIDKNIDDVKVRYGRRGIDIPHNCNTQLDKKIQTIKNSVFNIEKNQYDFYKIQLVNDKNIKVKTKDLLWDDDNEYKDIKLNKNTHISPEIIQSEMNKAYQNLLDSRKKFCEKSVNYLNNNINYATKNGVSELKLFPIGHNELFYDFFDIQKSTQSLHPEYFMQCQPEMDNKLEQLKKDGFDINKITVNDKDKWFFKISW